MELKEIFASRVRTLRNEQKVTQVIFAQDMGVATYTIKNWERAVNIPHLEMLCKIADYFGVSIDYLAGRKDDRS